MSDFVGPSFDRNRGATPEVGWAIMDGARRQTQGPSAYLEAKRYIKFCLACPHWVRVHPEHGPCLGPSLFTKWRTTPPQCPCTGFVDPFPGRPDRVLTRAQVDRMLRWRWELVKDKIYLLKDGNYGVWDRWSSPEWLAEAPKGCAADSS
jgi:hypothetical protein